ncbi:MAG TPA: thioredoxin [Dehalococcoidia bacterium]|nr:thioredoxin [Dehalococcoidia bacterium]
MATHSAYVFDVDERSFQSAVIERSRTLPVVVDFWAEWCGPCRMLGPVLERLAEEHAGAFELAKLNTDENPRISQAFRIQGIPAVKAFRDGRVVDEFVGALPEPRVRDWLQRFLPNEADTLAGRGDELAAAGHQNAAEDAYREALGHTPGHAVATIGLARILAGRGEAGEAEALRLLAALPADPRANQLRAEIGLRKAGGGADLAELERRVQENPRDPAAQYELGAALAAQGQYEPALEHLLESVRRDRTWNEDAARKAMIDLFNVLGEESSLTQSYRKQLSYVLF